MSIGHCVANVIVRAIKLGCFTCELAGSRHFSWMQWGAQCRALGEGHLVSDVGGRSLRPPSTTEARWTT